MNCAVVNITENPSGYDQTESVAPEVNHVTSTVTDMVVMTVTAQEPQSATNGGQRSNSFPKRLVSHPLLDASMKQRRIPGYPAPRFVRQASPMPFSQRPLMLIDDISNGCETPKTTAELKYPNPGPDIVEGDGEYPLQLPSGNCSSSYK
jgi:hypothetical protein